MKSSRPLLPRVAAPCVATAASAHSAPTEGPSAAGALRRRAAMPVAAAVLPVVAALLASSPGPVPAQQTPRASDDFEFVVNPVVAQRADPWVYRHTDGRYYFTGSVPAYDRIELRRAETLQGLAAAEPVTVWRKHDSGPMSWHVWAPELHHVDGRWYIHFAAGRADDVFRIRMYVLENASADPLEGEWVEKGPIRTRWDSFSLDATTFEHRGVRYLVWAQKDPEIRGNTNLYISEMENPWTVRGEQVMLTRPEYDWETRGFLVNEGAAVLKRYGRIFITYSGSATDARYAMGLLTADQDADLLDPASWTKSSDPVFRSSPGNGVYGPGHNSFTVAGDGTTDVIVYHGRSYRDIMGNPLYDPNRHARMQRLEWAPDGTPLFGEPVPDGPHVLTGTPPEGPGPSTFRNPLNDSGPDPWMTFWEGSYYLAATTWGGPEVGLTMRRAPTIAELKQAEPIRIFQDSTASRCCNYWAPEFFLLDGPNGRRWYGYFTGGAAGDDFVNTQFMHVIESAGTDPLGPYTYRGKLVERNALDGSVVELDGTLYAVYSVWNETQDLAIREMSSPWETVGGETVISRPTLAWERQEGTVNEGPVALHHEGRTFLVYSASACWGPNYKLGLLEWNGGDPLDAASWEKHPEPAFQRADSLGVFGPGHNTFFTSPDGTEQWIVYHANDQAADGCDMGRTPRIQPFGWSEDGTPDFGIPVGTSTELPVPSRDGG